MDNLLLILVLGVSISIWMTRGKAIKKIKQAKMKLDQQNEDNPIQPNDIGCD